MPMPIEILGAIAVFAMLMLLRGLTHSLTVRWTEGGTNVPSLSSDATFNLTPDIEQNADYSQALGAADDSLTFDINASQLVDLMIFVKTSDGSDCTVTFKANNSGAPDFTLTITTVGGSGRLLWWNECGLTNPITADITSFYISNDGSGGGTVSVNLRCGYNNGV